MQTFYSYHLPQNKAVFKLALLFGIAALVFYFIKFDVNTRKYNLNNYTLAIGGLIFMALFLIIAFLLKLKSDRSLQNPNKFFLATTYLQCPVGKNEFVKANFIDIASVTNIGNKYNGDILQIKPRNHAFTTLYIQANGFASREQFIQFENQLRSNLI